MPRTVPGTYQALSNDNCYRISTPLIYLYLFNRHLLHANYICVKSWTKQEDCKDKRDPELKAITTELDIPINYWLECRTPTRTRMGTVGTPYSLPSRYPSGLLFIPCSGFFPSHLQALLTSTSSLTPGRHPLLLPLSVSALEIPSTLQSPTWIPAQP